MNGLERRWHRRWEQGRTPARTVRLLESADLRHDCARVWALITPAENAVTLSPTTIARAFRVPGTPEGVGEQQCFLGHDGSATVIEVVEYVGGRRAVTRTVSPPEPVVSRTTYDLLPVGDGCRLTFGLDVDLPAGAMVDEQVWRSEARGYLARVRHALADGVAPVPGDSVTASDGPWSVVLDESFVAAAPVREPAGADRAAAARRIHSGHARSQPWRAAEPAKLRPRRRLPTRVVLPLVLAVSAGAVYGAGELLDRVPRPSSTTLTLAGGPGDGSPRVPEPVGTWDSRLLAPVVPPAGEGGWVALAEHQGRPVGFDPCRPVHWVLRTAGAPPDAQSMMTEAFGTLSAATGLVFVFDGVTDEAFEQDRPLVQAERYGQRYAPVLVAWSDEQERPELAGDVAGFAGSRAADPDGAGPRYVSGGVVLDGPQLASLPAGRAGQLGVVLHELGHLVGLDHVPDAADSMYEASGPASTYTVGALRGLAAVGAAPCVG